MTVPRPWARIAARLDAHQTERFWRRVDQRGPDECWEWQGYRFRFGHGGFAISGCGGPWQAHRVAYYLAHGRIDDTLLVCHTCDNPPCVNPAHLYQGTQKDNMRDVKERQRGRSCRVTHCSRGHALTPDSTIEKLQGDGYIHRSCRTCHNAHTLSRYYRKLRPPHLRGLPPQHHNGRKKAA